LGMKRKKWAPFPRVESPTKRQGPGGSGSLALKYLNGYHQNRSGRQQKR
jgi:hypothetical protein